MQQVGRNDPCPCGSGKKYKYCHGRVTSQAHQGLIEVLYVHPAKQGVDFYAQHLAKGDRNLGRPYGLMPLGLPGLVNVLRENGIEVRGINYPVEKRLDRLFPDPADFLEILEPAKRPVRLAPANDGLGPHRPYSRKILGQLVGRGRIDVNQVARSSHR